MGPAETQLHSQNRPARSLRQTNFSLTQVELPSASMEQEVLTGLLNVPKKILPKYLYDAEGSRLFDRICELPEYYPTRVETAILARYAGEILDRIGHDLCVIEPGAGACRKSRFLLETGNVSTFIPVDISTEHLRHSAQEVASCFPHVAVHAVAMDFLAALPGLQPILPRGGRRVIFYPGSSIGNFDPPEACRLLTQFGRLLNEDDMLLIGFDLRKDPELLRRAYDDSQGVTAAFNLNLLSRLNRELGTDFDVDAFRHIALYHEAPGRIEMHLESLIAQEVAIAHERIFIDASERIHTENSYKYSVAQFDAMAAGAGFSPVGGWRDSAGCFAVGLYAKRLPKPSRAGRNARPRKA